MLSHRISTKILTRKLPRNASSLAMPNRAKAHINREYRRTPCIIPLTLRRRCLAGYIGWGSSATAPTEGERNNARRSSILPIDVGFGPIWHGQGAGVSRQFSRQDFRGDSVAEHPTCLLQDRVRQDVGRRRLETRGISFFRRLLF